ncbi:beta-ketoacyl synthase N-terminal-like domain-containing protein [Verrucomicrobium sp. 3C]|uniref:beta-ketoacyl synthase N-terminal-like domain-containing protein n=1 Tax=Verrucomicrobium sp. 3C TaxID=1134055 RepID=UPI0018C9BAE6|nr:beta-ketoacyl synthase N-terminal-like domain-containing protein [Verrucomicrobium sp. 3C]
MTDRSPLYVSAVGIVSPAGLGAEPLRQLHSSAEKEMALSSSPSRSFPVFLVDRSDPRWNRWVEEPRLRRAGGLALFLVEAIHQALVGLREQARSRMGLISVFNNGSIAHTARFFAGYRGQGRRFASPLLFPETVYNAATSHAAAVFGLLGPTCTLVGDESAWVEGIRMARIWLELGRASAVLVAAAEEVTSVSLDAFHSAGWLRKGRAFRPAEGSAALLLTTCPQDALFVLVDAPASIPYRNQEELASVASRLACELPPGVPVYQTAEGSWLGPLEKALLRQMPSAGSFPYLGEAFAVSAGWHTIRAASLLSERRREILLPLWGSIHQISWLHLRCLGDAGGRRRTLPPSRFDEPA